MSLEEDVLMRRMREIVAVLRRHDMLETCKECGTYFAVGLDICPNCQVPLKADGEDDTGPSDDYDSYNVEQLRAHLTSPERKLSGAGNKAELIARLREDDAKKAGTPSPSNPFGQ